jgi:hypothetical protein
VLALYLPAAGPGLAGVQLGVDSFDLFLVAHGLVSPIWVLLA